MSEGGAGEPRKRRWNSDRYPKMVTVRVTLEEHEELLRRAQRTRLSASRFLVRCGLSQRLPPLRDRPAPTPEERRDLEFLLYQLRKVGTNLNQLAKRTNAARLFGRMRPPASKVEQAASAAEGLIRLLRKRL